LVTARFSTDIQIDAPKDDVWGALADIGSIYRWNPGVVESHATTAAETGLGACRYCDLGGKNYLDEEVVEWREGERLTMRVTGTNLPFKSVDIRFSLRAQENGTLVTVSPVYELKYGVLGKLLDRVYVGRTYEQGMNDLLAGLKKYVETGGQS
jgi:hypothetical protein